MSGENDISAYTMPGAPASHGVMRPGNPTATAMDSSATSTLQPQLAA